MLRKPSAELLAPTRVDKVKSRSKNQGADFDTLSSLGLFSRPWVNEGCVRNSSSFDPGPLLDALGIETLEHQPLVPCHATPIIPLLTRVIMDSRRLPRVPVGVSVLDGDQVVVGERGGAGKGEGVRLDGALVQRPPDVDDAVAAAQQRVGLVGQVLAHALRRRQRRLVDVRREDGLALGRRVGAPDGVVEEEDPVRPGHVVEQELFYFRVVVGADAVVVGEVALGRLGHALDRGKGVRVQGEVGLAATDVLDPRVLRVDLDVALRLAGRRVLDVVDGLLSLGGKFSVVYVGDHGAPGNWIRCDGHAGDVGMRVKKTDIFCVMYSYSEYRSFRFE